VNRRWAGNAQTLRLNRSNADPCTQTWYQPMPDRAKALKQLLSKLAASVEPVQLHAVTAAAPLPASGSAPAVVDGDAVATSHGGCVFHGDSVLREFVRSFMLWEAPTPKAAGALDRICRAVVDANELRASLAEEIVALIGRGYARADERAGRLKAALNDIYRREHSLRLSHLCVAGKKGALAYLLGLSQTPRYVATRTALVGLGVHAMPVDGRLFAILVDAGVCPVDAGTDGAATWIEKHVPAGELLGTYALLQAGADALASRALAVVIKPMRAKAKPGSASVKSNGLAPARRKPSAQRRA